MSTVKFGTLAQAPEWRKHLRPDGKRQTAKRERKLGQKIAVEPCTHTYENHRPLA